MANQTPHSKDAATNARGIPFAPFIERVEDYVTTRADVEKTLQSFQEMISYVLFGIRLLFFSFVSDLREGNK